MNTKAFLLILVLVLVLGGSIGGAFAGGVALGKTQSEDSVAPGLAVMGGSDSPLGQASLGLPQRDQLRQGFQSGDLTQQDLEQLRQRFGSGELGQQDLDRLREGFRSGGLGQQDLGQAFRQFQGGAPGGTGGRGFPGRTGTIGQIEGNTLTISTEDGTVQASIGADTNIQRLTEVTLAEGMRITLIGQAGEDGTVQAVSIFVVLDDQEGFFGGGFAPRDRR